MSQPPSSDGWEQIDRACDKFESRWRAGPRPRLEDFLSGAGPRRARLLRELLRVEVEYRRKAGEQPAWQDYRERFPDLAGVLDEVLGGTAGGEALERTATHVPGGAEDDAPPEVPGYEVLGVLGRGGMGVVYRARQVRLDREVALKTVRAALPDPATRQRFEDEARVVARFDHPNLVRVFDSGEANGRPWFAMELVEGGTLARALRGGPWQPREAARLVAVLADAVEYAHERGVVHRDLKPANVLLSAACGLAGQPEPGPAKPQAANQALDGVPKIADFGLARLLEAESAARTQAGCCLGTPPYMPPEQAAGMPGASGRAADVFGLGAILYELLTGQAPFAADSPVEALERARQGEVRPPRQVNPRFRPVLERICLKALARQPQQRHATAAELARELRRYLAPRRRWWAVAAVPVVLVLMGLGWLLRGVVAKPAGPAPLPLAGDLIVTLTSEDGARKRGLRVDQPGALPAVAGDGFHVEARLNQPGHVYLVLLTSQGKAVPLYPWNAHEIVQPKLVSPPEQPARKVVHSPTAEHGDWILDRHDGLETVLLLARKTPLPDDVDLAGLLGPVPRVAVLNPREWAIRGGDEGQSVDFFDRGDNRGIEKEARLRDDPLLKIMARLQQRFDVVRAVRFAHQGE
jgi:hypothetical protein